MVGGGWTPPIDAANCVLRPSPHWQLLLDIGDQLHIDQIPKRLDEGTYMNGLCSEVHVSVTGAVVGVFSPRVICDGATNGCA